MSNDYRDWTNGRFMHAPSQTISPTRNAIIVQNFDGKWHVSIEVVDDAERAGLEATAREILRHLERQ